MHTITYATASLVSEATFELLCAMRMHIVMAKSSRMEKPRNSDD
jgi:hypothetical protein